jgi:hypothetical protein
VLSLAILSTVQLELHVCEDCLTQELKQTDFKLRVKTPGSLKTYICTINVQYKIRENICTREMMREVFNEMHMD